MLVVMKVETLLLMKCPWSTALHICRVRCYFTCTAYTICRASPFSLLLWLSVLTF